jgi:hypothetical protein
MRHVMVGITCIVLVIAIAGFVAQFFLQKERPLHTETLCPADGPLGHVVLLVDKTDPLTFTQKQAFGVLLDDIVTRRVAPGFLISVFVLGEDFTQTAKPLLEICNPGQGEGKSELNANLKRLHLQYEARFREPLLAQAEALQSASPARYSPILEMLQITSINGFRKHSAAGERRLIVVSDMLHNTAQFSMYKAGVDFRTFSASDYGKKTHLDLANVTVELHYLMNYPQLQTRRHLLFWEELFAKAGAKVVAVRPMEG